MQLILSLILVLAVVALTLAGSDSSEVKTHTTESGDVVTYTTKEELVVKLKEQAEARVKQGIQFDDSLTPEQLKEFQEWEKDLRKDLARAELEHGKYSNERAAALHKLGANMYRQHRFEELFDLSKEIVKIHETLDGPDSVMVGKALGNVGTVADRLGLRRECELAMKRSLYIMLHAGGLQPDSREVLITRGKMMSFQIKDGETTEGLTHEEYRELMEKDEL